MSSQLNLRLLATVMLITALCASAAPLTHADSPPGEASGDEEEEGGQKREIYNLPGHFSTMETWEQAIGATKRHQQEFEEEFGDNVKYDSLNDYSHSSFPNKYPDSNFSKEASLQRLAEDLHIYMVLLKHVEMEYPNSSILTEVKASIPLLIAVIKAKMRNSSQVIALTSSQENQLLNFNNPDAFNRKLTAHSILSSLRSFLIEGKRYFRRWESFKNQAAHTNGPQTS